MSSPSLTSLRHVDLRPALPSSWLNVDLQPGKPPMLWVDRVDDVPRWAAAHPDAHRAPVIEHGARLVRGRGDRPGSL